MHIASEHGCFLIEIFSKFLPLTLLTAAYNHLIGIYVPKAPSQ